MPARTRARLLQGLFLLAFAATGAAAQAAVLAATPLSRTDLPWWRTRLDAKQAELRAGRYDLIYFGDSITQQYEAARPLPGGDWPAVWQRFYGDRHAVNLGFKGDTTAHLLWRIEHGEAEVQGIAGPPKVAIVLIGANNMGRVHWSAADTLAGIDADVQAIRTRLPHTRVLLLGVLPSIRSPWVDQATAAVNAGLAARYGHQTTGAVVFVDAGHVLLRDGRPDPALFIDPLLTPPDPPLHPNAEGQARIAAAIEPALAAMLGDRRHG